MTLRLLIEVRDCNNEDDLARTLIHEYAHAMLHFESDEDDAEAQLEVEAEAVAYVVCRHFGLDVDNSTFYLAAWDNDVPETLYVRLGRIASSEKILTILEWIELSAQPIQELTEYD